VILCVLLQVILRSSVWLNVFDLNVLILPCWDFSGIVFVDLILGINLTGFDLPLKFCDTVKLNLHFSELLHIFKLASLSIFDYLGLLFWVIGTFRVLLLPFACYACLVRIDRHVGKIHKVM
jgi:hypothetical protein